MINLIAGSHTTVNFLRRPSKLTDMDQLSKFMGVLNAKLHCFENMRKVSEKKKATGDNLYLETNVKHIPLTMRMRVDTYLINL